MDKPGHTRRDFMKKVGAGTAAFALSQSARTEEKPPNILFLFTDDQRFDAIGALCNQAVKTPNMDKLVAGGTVFTHAHIMGSLVPAVCMPSRAMLMTGRGLFHLLDQGRDIPPEHIMLPELLRQEGYETFGTGKWHNGPPAYARCFSRGASIFYGGMSNHLEVPVHDFDPEGRYAKESRYSSKKFSSELFSDEAIDFLERQTGDAPFFAYVSYTAPHDPRMAPKEFADMYPAKSIEVPPNFLTEHPFDNGELRIRDEILAQSPRTPEVVQEHIAAYYAMIAHLDYHIGRVLDALENSGQADNTIVIFAGDNGLAVGQHGLLGKQNLYEHSVRVPLVFAGPGIPAGKRTDALCYLLDVFPTLCDLSGIAVPETVEGKSLLPIIQGQKNEVRGSVFAAYRQFQRMVRQGGWKLIRYNVEGKQTTQLFDLASDPWEVKNLAGEPERKERLGEMDALLASWMKQVDDICDPSKPNWI